MNHILDSWFFTVSSMEDKAIEEWELSNRFNEPSELRSTGKETLGRKNSFLRLKTSRLHKLTPHFEFPELSDLVK